MENEVRELRAQGESGDSHAQYQLGNIYQQGLKGVTPDLDEAIRWYQQAAAQGHLDSNFNLGLIFLRVLPRTNRQGRPAEGLQHLEAAAEAGDLEAQCFLGEVLITGEGSVPIDRDRGVSLLQDAADRGGMKACNRLGMFLMQGRQLEPDPRRAVVLFKQAAEARDPEGMFNLGMALNEGNGVKVNQELALKLFKRAAEAGHPGAMHNYGSLLIMGHGAPADLQTGTEFIFRAAQAGHADAQFEAGQALRLGRGVPEDPATAVQWYQAAAAQEHPEGLFSLGLCYEHGVGTAQDLPRAEQCYQHATMAGHGGAANNLGIMFVRGMGVAQDPAMAEELFEYAISLGNDDALFSLGLLCAQTGRLEDAYFWGLLSTRQVPEGDGPRPTEHVGQDLTPEQVENARRRAESWTRPSKTMAFHRFRKNPDDG